jgi:diguanylate cyclase (GGDEF)-like protein
MDRLSSNDDPAGSRFSPAAGLTLAAAASDHVLTAVGEVVYEWMIGSDAITWGANVAEVLGLGSPDPVATGRLYAALFDPANLTSRNDAILNGTAHDQGTGVPYEVEYVLLPEGQGHRRLVIDDVGRWYSGPDGRPARAVGVIRIINARREREERLAFLSRYDELTGLFNRHHLLTTAGDALNDAKRSRTSIALMVVALDNFRAINEAYGFDTADKVFAAVAQRIKAEMRDGDAIGRYSGGKLCIVLMNCDEENMHAAAERFHAAVSRGVISAEGSAVAVTVSIGGVSLPRHGRTVREALAHAQDALHRARERGTGRFVAYAASAGRDARRRANAAFSSEIAAALDEKRLRLFFQPVVDIATREVRFHEALLRLERPNGTFAAAGDFIELSEQLGLIRLIDDYTLSRALETLDAHPKVSLSLNVSGETVADPAWLSHLAQSLLHRPDVASRLIVEITETAVIRRLEDASRFVATVHDLGCRVAVDDFGAGFSSFRHLRTLSFDLVKIAGSFIENLPRSADDRAFVKALTDLAANFRAEVVAEWVRDEETVALLKGFGVTLMQGTLTGDATLEWGLTHSVAGLAVRKAG